MGFVNLEIDGDIATKMTGNQELLDKWKKEHPEPKPREEQISDDEAIDIITGNISNAEALNIITGGNEEWQKNEAIEIRGKVVDGETVRAAGGISTWTEQSDKLGYDWVIYTVNDIDVRKDYVEQADPKGTSADNPIVWIDGMTPINNAYYLKDGKIYVYMDGWVEWETSV